MGFRCRSETGTTLDHRRILDLQHRVLFRQWRHQDDRGRVTMLTYARAVYLHDRHLLSSPSRSRRTTAKGDITIHSPRTILGRRFYGLST
ncbi:MAG: hypothetical protein MRJ92_13090 [Nitrospira sp.]|nr:hypothetical protein [Nitrospira sp.]